MFNSQKLSPTSVSFISYVFVMKKVKADRPRRGGGRGGARPHSLAQRPEQHHRDILTGKSDRCRRKLL